MIDANSVKRFFQDWKEALALGMSAVALLLSSRNALRDRRIQRLQQPVLKFHVRIAEYLDKELFKKNLPPEQLAAKAMEFPFALYVKAINEGLYPATVECCGCMITHVGMQSEVVVAESKCKLTQGDSHEWVVKFRVFPYRFLRIVLFNSFGGVWAVDNRTVLSLHRQYVHRWPYTDGRLSLLSWPLALLFLRWYQRRFRPMKVEVPDRQSSE